MSRAIVAIAICACVCVIAMSQIWNERSRIHWNLKGAWAVSLGLICLNSVSGVVLSAFESSDALEITDRIITSTSWCCGISYLFETLKCFDSISPISRLTLNRLQAVFIVMAISATVAILVTREIYISVTSF